LRDLIQPVMPGNPWMRPKTILHDNAGIALYVQPSQQQPQQESLESSSSSSSSMMAPQHEIIQDALSQHFKILQDVSKKVAAMYSHGDGMDTIQCSIGRYLQGETMKSHQQQAMSVSQQEQGEEASDSSRIQRQNTTAALTGFYQHLLTCWYGRSLFDLQLGYFDNGTDDTTAIDSSMNGDGKANDDASFVEYGDFAGPHCTVRNGMHQVLEPLLQEHDLERNCIRLEQVVTSIHPSCNDSSGAHSTGGDVVVETANGRCVYGKTCVVTLPLGCLRQQEQSHNDDDDVSTNHLNNNIFAKTPLSVEKRIAIQHMNMGAYKKVFLTFDRCFWDTKPAFLGLVLMHDDNDDDDVDDVRIQKKNPLGKYLLLRSNTAPCLEAILAGDQGTWATGKSDDVIQSAVLDFMQRAMMPISSSSDKDDEQIIIQDWCTSCHVTRWEEDVYSRGAYSSWSLGALPRHRTELSRPEWNERLYFAGEATHDGFEGSVHAALLSGTHAASSVAKHLVCAAGLAMTKEAENGNKLNSTNATRRNGPKITLESC
jgi:Flavin containing amine oxidoreductase